MQNVWAMRTLNLKSGVLRLFEWTMDFDMHNQRNTHAQVWIRLMALPQEYWMEQTLRDIASAVGTPLVLDNATLKRLFGHYARILVDIDFSKKKFIKLSWSGKVLPILWKWFMKEFQTFARIVRHFNMML